MNSTESIRNRDPLQVIMTPKLN